jgi:7-carboxy-7-deazaguanine synthase
LQIAEIFESIHGEINGHHQGRICTFIRTSGCNLKCPYCDTPNTQDSTFGSKMSLHEILTQASKFQNDYICVTGGEPLLQDEIWELLDSLYYNDFLVSVETNGTFDITPYYRYVDSFIIDFKVGVHNYNSLIRNYLNLRNKDVIKFVIGSEKDLINVSNNYSFLRHHYKQKSQKPIIAFSPILSENFTPKLLFECLKEHKIYNALISLQIHKFAGFN